VFLGIACTVSFSDALPYDGMHAECVKTTVGGFVWKSATAGEETATVCMAQCEAAFLSRACAYMTVWIV
jgi:hypothetical protein